MQYQTDPTYLKEAAYQEAADLDIRTFIIERHRSYPQSWYQWLFAELQLPPNGRLLELGCGPGDLWLENWHELVPGWQVVLSDLSAGMVTAAKERIGRCHEKEQPGLFHFAVLDTAVLPFPSNHFDAVLAFGLLDHLPYRQQVLAEIRRVLKAEGQFYTSAGGRTHLQELEALMRPFLPDVNYGGDADRFGLHNGADLLQPFFTEIKLKCYPNELVFQEPEPVMVYALSETRVRERLTAEKLTAFQTYVRQQFASQGEIRVTTEKGLFRGRIRG